MRSLRSDQRGQSYVEYLIVLCVVGVAALGAWRAFGTTIQATVGQQRESIEQMQAVPMRPPTIDTGGPRASEGDDAPEVVVTTLPSTGTGPDPAGAVAAERPMTEAEAGLALSGADELLGWDPALEALDGQLGPVLTNPVFVFRDNQGRTSYFGYVDGRWVQVDFDRDGDLSTVLALDDYSAAVWLCEAGSAQACAAKQAMDERSRAEMDQAGALLTLAVGVTPAGIVVDAADMVRSCPSSPASFDCGAAALGLVPGVPGLGRLDEVADGASAVRRGARGRPTAVDPADVPHDVPVRDPEHFLDLGWDPAVSAFRASEARTATRVEELEGVTLRRADSGGDWVGSDGRVYDAFGGTGDNGIFTLPNDRSIPKHVAKADVIVIDYNEFDPTFDAVMAETIRKLEAAAGRMGREVEILTIPRR